MNTYQEIERFQRKAGQADFPFRDTGARAYQERETGWNLLDQVAAGVSSPTVSAASAPQNTVTLFEPPRVEEPASQRTPEVNPTEAQDAALERFAALLQARHRREAEEARRVPRGNEPLKHLLRRIAVGADHADESQAARC